MKSSEEEFRDMKTAYGKRKNEFKESKYSFEFFTEKGKTIVDGENIPVSFKVLNQLLNQPSFINYEVKKDNETFTSGQIKSFVAEEKEVVKEEKQESPLDIMRATFEMNRLYSEDLERVTKKYSSKFAEYDQEVDARISKQRDALNEKLESIEFANKRRAEIQEEEFALERKKWELEKEQILARRKVREEKFSLNAVFGKVAEGALEALSANPEQSVNVAIQLIKIVGAAWRGEKPEIEV
jgi:hypothetical protein